MNPFKTVHDKLTRNIRIIKKGFSSVTILPRFAHIHSQPFRDGRVGYFSLLEECSEHQAFYLKENYLPLYFEAIFVECIGVPFGLNFISEIEFKDIVENSLSKLDSVHEKYRDEVTKDDDLHFRLRVARIHLQTAIVHVLQRQSFVDLRRTLAADLLSEADAIVDELTRSERRRLSQNNRQVIEIFVKLVKIDLIHFCLDSFPREKRRLLLLEAQNCVEDITSRTPAAGAL